MKRVLFFLFIVLLFNPIIVYAQECDVVWPQFGVVSCETFFGSTAEKETKTPICQESQCTFDFSCAGKTECQFFSEDVLNSKNECPGILSCLEYSIYKNGNLVGKEWDYGRCPTKDPAPNLQSFETVTIIARCWDLLSYSSIDSSSTVTLTYRNKYLYDENPDHPKHKVDQSVGCIPQGIMYKSGYTSSLPARWVDNQGSQKGTKPQDLVDNLPSSMAVSETLSYFYGWRDVPGINAIKDKEGDLKGFCGGNLGDRKILSYQEISSGGNCYIVPTGVEKTVECCYNEDCKWKDSSGKLVCNPETFTCSEERPCNSDFDCEVIGQTSCFNNIETSWLCYLDEPWEPYKGTCKKSTKNVQCCSDSECGSGQYCDREEGCLDKYLLEECPQGKCCEPGGSYKTRDCPSGKQCCHVSGSYVGTCKDTCGTVAQSTEEQILSNNDMSGSTGMSILGGSSLLFGGLIVVLAVVGFVLWKNKSKLVKTRKKESKSVKSGFCTKCGTELEKSQKFCVGCGKKVN